MVATVQQSYITKSKVLKTSLEVMYNVSFIFEPFTTQTTAKLEVLVHQLMLY